MSAIPSPNVLTPLADALALLMQATPAPAPQLVALDEAAGLVAAETVQSPRPLPAEAIARRRGVAVSAAEVVGASPYAPVILATTPRPVLPGDPLPPTRDAVLPPDAATAAGAFHEIGQPAYPGEGAVLPGGDLAEGAVIVRAGETVSPTVLLALGLAGIGSVAVRRPAIAVMSAEGTTGAEPGLAWLRAALIGAGCRLTKADAADLVIRVSRHIDGGPAGSGGTANLVTGLAMSPGSETAVATGDARPVVTIAPRFDALAGVLFGLLLPLIATRTGRRLRGLARPLTRKLVSQVGLADLALLRASGDGYEPLAVGQAPLAALLAADAAVLIEPGSEGFAAGSPLAAIPLKEPFEPL